VIYAEILLAANGVLEWVVLNSMQTQIVMPLQTVMSTVDSLTLVVSVKTPLAASGVPTSSALIQLSIGIQLPTLALSVLSYHTVKLAMQNQIVPGAQRLEIVMPRKVVHAINGLLDAMATAQNTQTVILAMR